jgi:ribonucleoside-diphosphate reductase alpha chain
MSLQYGVPLEDYVRKFSHMRFEPQGHTKNPDIRIAKSLIDYIFRWLGITFLPGYKEASMGVLPGAAASTEDDPEPNSAAGGQRSEVRGQSATPRPAIAEKPGTTKPAGDKRKSDGGMTATLAPSPQPPAPHANGHTNGNGHGDFGALLARAGILPKDAGPTTARSEQFADFQSDAPACDNCGAITVRSGNCYLCHNCGSSMGCS